MWALLFASSSYTTSVSEIDLLSKTRGVISASNVASATLAVHHTYSAQVLQRPDTYERMCLLLKGALIGQPRVPYSQLYSCSFPSYVTTCGMS
jgi:hypothetical protein